MRLLLWQSLCIAQKCLLQFMPPPVDLDEIDVDLDKIDEVASRKMPVDLKSLTRVIQTAVYTSVKCLGDPRASWSRFKSKFDSKYSDNQDKSVRPQLVPKASLELEMIRVLAKEHRT
ncbi:hypothetical protein B0H13DRAFT_1850629 [Mycena leptocephala]|nr:hypothetical protein B0H13DRAFT_1850629 [Mycena leptocephala]